MLPKNHMMAPKSQDEWPDLKFKGLQKQKGPGFPEPFSNSIFQIRIKQFY